MEFCIQFGKLIGLQRESRALEDLNQHKRTAKNESKEKTTPLFEHIVQKNPVNYAHTEVW